ncbi:general secretion pathway protein M [Pseudoalteromonas ulvae UL12]|uniref:type II secretion system protein GspM n=1 Tax=Pseudoalteromonas ulvae TaxID=107327 RepID=UPI00186B8886|nr:type II secretion system protein M [Pseudoalteromonas ulvae]MBE0364297.1 general secretion pathway protein M [Pseudoalteromonas ulvae UL12]
MNQVVKYWQSLNAKEQKLLSIAGGVFVLFVLVMGVIRPLNAALAKAEKELASQQQLAVWLQTSIQKIKASNPRAVSSSASLSSLVNTSKNRYNITINRMQPKDDSLRVSIDTVEFNKLVDWLAELTAQHGVMITNVELSKHDSPGFVKVNRLVIEK